MEKQTLGRMISSIRREKGMTQLDLAEKMCVTDKAVSKWERDLSCPDVGSFPKLAEVLGVSAEQLLQAGTDSPAPRGAKALSPTPALILKAVALAMGVAVAVLSLLGSIDARSGFTMLGIGLACAALLLLQGDGAAGR